MDHKHRCRQMSGYYLICLLNLFGFIGFAQSNNISLLTNENLTLINADSISIKNAQLQIQSIENQKPDSAIVLYWQTYMESQKIGYHRGSSNALRKLGELYYKKCLYDTARIYLKQSIRFSQLSGEPKAVFGTLIYLGGIDYYHVHYEQALNHFYDAIDVLHHFKVKAPAAFYFNTYYNIALTWKKLGSDKRAKEALTMLIKLSKQSGDSAQLMLCNTLTAYLCYPDDASKKLIFYNKALSYRTKKDSDATILHLYNSLAKVHTKIGDLDSAQYYVQQAFKISNKNKEVLTIDRMHTRDALAEIYHVQGKYKEAAKVWQSLTSEIEEKKVTDMFIHIAVEMAENYHTMGRVEAAYNLLSRYIKIKDSIEHFQKGQSTELWLQSYMAQKDKIVQEHKLKLYKQENLIKTKNFWIGVFVFSTLILAMLFFIIIRSYRHNQKLQIARLAQLQQESEINQLKAQVKGEEQERNRIAIDLHDGIAAELWGIKISMSSMRALQSSDGDQREKWEMIYAQLQQTVLRVRTTAHNLMPDLLLDEGLLPAVDTLCQRMKTQTGLDIDFQEYGNTVRLNREIELSLFRMIQELIQNAFKHAKGATTLLVQLGTTDRLLTITVEDNGIGLPVGNWMELSGFGLGNIKKRVNYLQGHFELQSQPGEGTTAYLEFDLHHLL